MGLSPDQSRRYERHVMLPEIGEAGQERLLASSVAMIGAGGLGSPVGIYLAAAGVGRIRAVDGDRLELSNLQRQIAHGTPDVGRPKVESFGETVGRLNPDVELDLVPERASPDNVLELTEGHDLVLDCTDNFPTRYLMNDAARLAGKPLVTGAILAYAGQVTVVRPETGAPCYRCLYPTPPGPKVARERSFAGVLGVVPGVIGTVMATEALKALLGIGEALVGRLLVHDALEPSFRIIRYPADPACALCGRDPAIERPAWIPGGP